MSEIIFWMNLVGSILIIYCAGVGVTSVYMHTRVRWWATPMGRHLMAYMGVMAAVLVLSTLSVILRWVGLGDSWWFQLIRLIVFLGLPCVMTQRLVLQIRAQRRNGGKT